MKPWSIAAYLLTGVATVLAAAMPAHESQATNEYRLGRFKAPRKHGKDDGPYKVYEGTNCTYNKDSWFKLWDLYIPWGQLATDSKDKCGKGFRDNIRGRAGCALAHYWRCENVAGTTDVRFHFWVPAFCDLKSMEKAVNRATSANIRASLGDTCHEVKGVQWPNARW